MLWCTLACVSGFVANVGWQVDGKHKCILLYLDAVVSAATCVGMHSSNITWRFQRSAVLCSPMSVISCAAVHADGTVEWLPGSPLGNSGFSWSDVLLGDLPNI